MKTFASKEKQSVTAGRKARPYVHYPMGPVQLAQRAEIHSILRSTGVQAKLTIGQPNDKYEQEADRVADQVMRMPDPKLQRQPENEEEEETLQAKPLADQITPLVQRQEEPEEEEEAVQAKFKDDEMIQRMCPECKKEQSLQRQTEEEEEEGLQAKSKTGETPTVTPSFESRINSLKGSGQPLDPANRGFFEPRFGRDFSNVRVHSDNWAGLIARSINARAFTLGNHVVMGAGEYQPKSQSGQRLLGHELTHVVQQGGGVYRKKRALTPFSQETQSTPVAGLIQRDYEDRKVFSLIGPFSKKDFKKGKGFIFEKLRRLTIKDPNVRPLLKSRLRGDDLWLALNLFQYGPEKRWPIHLRIKWEMKGWGRGKGKVFDILRAAKGAELNNRKLTAVLRRVFAPRSEDIWYARALQVYGLEKQWSESIRYQSYLRRAISILEGVGFGRQIRMVKPKYDKRYWSLRKAGNLLLKAGKRPSDAVKAMFSKQEAFSIDLWSIDCAELVQVAHWYALLRILGPGLFDQKVKGVRFVLIPHRAPGIEQIKIYDRHKMDSPVYTKIGAKIVKLKGDANRIFDQAIARAPVGSRVMWTNELGAHPRDMWTNENAIKLGPKLFGAHGMKGRIHTRQEIELHMSMKYHETYMNWSEEKIRKNMGKIREYAKQHIFVAEVEYYKTF